MEIENKLLKFRQESAQKQKEQESVESRQAFGEKAKTYFEKFWSYGIRDESGQKNQAGVEPVVKSEPRQRRKTVQKLSNEMPEDDLVDEDEPVSFQLQMTKMVFQVILWLSLFALFIKLEFGAVYFVISSLVIIYLNTGKRKSSTLSAYSVFNPNVERIQGTITPEQLQSSLLGGL